MTIAMAGWLHGVFVGACWVGSPQGGFSLSLFCNYVVGLVGSSCRRAGAPLGVTRDEQDDAERRDTDRTDAV